MERRAVISALPIFGLTGCLGSIQAYRANEQVPCDKQDTNSESTKGEEVRSKGDPISHTVELSEEPGAEYYPENGSVKVVFTKKGDREPSNFEIISFDKWAEFEAPGQAIEPAKLATRQRLSCDPDFVSGIGGVPSETTKGAPILSVPEDEGVTLPALVRAAPRTLTITLSYQSSRTTKEVPIYVKVMSGSPIAQSVDN